MSRGFTSGFGNFAASSSGLRNLPNKRTSVFTAAFSGGVEGSVPGSAEGFAAGLAEGTSGSCLAGGAATALRRPSGSNTAVRTMRRRHFMRRESLERFDQAYVRLLDGAE